jgi:glyoxylase-like metal-dependent hydrolase (beta-lactamase superfamily II)
MVTDKGGGADKPMGVATGDFVFVGDLGRPDLLESAAGFKGKADPSAHRLYGTVRRFLEWPDYLQVWPAHGAGSACGKALGAGPDQHGRLREDVQSGPCSPRRRNRASSTSSSTRSPSRRCISRG